MNARLHDNAISGVEAAGFDAARLARVGERIAADIEAERYDGARLMVARRGVPVLDLTMGYADRAAGRPMQKDSAFSVMSISKVMTAVALLQKVERGDVSLLSPVASVIPEFAAREKGRVTVYQVLTHTAGMGMGVAPLPVDKLGNLQECARAICALPLESTPGEVVSYSASMGFTILGEMTRRLDGGTRAFREILDQEVFKPLGMHDTAIGLAPRLASRRVPVVVRDPDAPELNAKFQADRDNACTETTELPSGGGTFSTAGDVLRFGEALRQGGALDGARVLSPAMVHLMRQNHTGDRPNSMMNSSRALHGMPPFPAFLGLGLFLRGTGIFPSHMPSLASPGTFGGWGLGSMGFWVDPERELTFVMLTAGLMERIRNLLRFQRIGDMVISSLLED
jgi:CubicO group peptidase (beta-lactamase class C family)